jgi:hypothetical protein
MFKLAAIRYVWMIALAVFLEWTEVERCPQIHRWTLSAAARGSSAGVERNARGYCPNPTRRHVTSRLLLLFLAFDYLEKHPNSIC